jgi:type I restriction enzyme R subunit
MSAYATPEAQARARIDEQLESAGWSVQSFKDLNLKASLGVAVCEYPTLTGPSDYLLHVDGKAIGVLEAKAEGKALGGVSEQATRYAAGIAKPTQTWDDPLPFTFESNANEWRHRDLRDPESRSRNVFSIQTPESLHSLVQDNSTFRQNLRNLPQLQQGSLRDCQFTAINGLEASLAANNPRALVQMATGSGKTIMAIHEIYRLIKYGKARRILFLVDRANLGRQADQEFQQFDTPEEGRKFTDLYNVKRLHTGHSIEKTDKVVISTIQRLYSALIGVDLQEDDDEVSPFQSGVDIRQAKNIQYNRDLPPETFDVIIIDECHRSIYNLWKQVLDYFDAFLIGLTATPSKHTLAFFDKNLVSEYPVEQSVIDQVNVGYDIYRIETEISKQGSTIEEGNQVEIIDKTTRRHRWESLDEDLEYKQNELDRTVTTPDQIRTIITQFRDALFTDLFPDRPANAQAIGEDHPWVPKTLVFAKDDSHADRIVDIIREVFGKGNDFCKKITYRVGKKESEDLIRQFRIAPEFRIAVSVDMIATGTDIKPLECLLFLRDVKSSVYYEQMKGRGCRTVDPNSLRSVTPDARGKTRFVLVDAVGVTQSVKADTRPLDQKKSVPTQKLLQQVAQGAPDDETLSSLASRLTRLDLNLTPDDRKKIEDKAGKPLIDIARDLFSSVDPDAISREAQGRDGSPQPSAEVPQKLLDEVASELKEDAVTPFHQPEFRNLLVDLQKQSDLIVDTHSIDTVTYAGLDTEKAQGIIQSWQGFLEENKDEITALQIIYAQRQQDQHLTFRLIKDLADAMSSAPYHLAPENIWTAYEVLEKQKVRGARPEKLLTTLVTMVRYASGAADELVPFPDLIDQRFQTWLQQHDGSFDPEQIEWLQMIKDHIAQAVAIDIEDFQEVPFNQRGGLARARKVFGERLNPILEELNEVLVA